MSNAFEMDKARKLSALEYLAPPENMPEDQKLIWDGVVKTMPRGFYFPCDRYILEAFCKCQLLIKKAEEHLAVESHVIMDVEGKIRVNPWVNVLNGQNTLLLRLAEKLKITTSMRIESTGGVVKKALMENMEQTDMFDEEEDRDPREGLV